MPANIIASFAQKSGKSEAEVEKLWNQAKKEAEDAEGVDDVYAYATGILKKMLSIQENIHMEINESNISVENIYNLIDDIVESLLEQRKRKTPNIATLKAIATSLTNSLKGVSISEKENVDMSKQEQRRALTKQFIQKAVDGQKFDAVADLKEMIRLSKEIRYDDLAASVEI